MGSRRKKNVLDQFLDHPWRTSVRGWSQFKKQRADWHDEATKLAAEREKSRAKKSRTKQARVEARKARQERRQDRLNNAATRRQGHQAPRPAAARIVNRPQSSQQSQPQPIQQPRPATKPIAATYAKPGSPERAEKLASATPPAQTCGRPKTDGSGPCQHVGVCPDHVHRKGAVSPNAPDKHVNTGWIQGLVS